MTTVIARWFSALAGVIGGAAIAVALAVPASAQEPPGNNGTVKVDEHDLDGGAGDRPGNNNDPHLDDCTGQVEWCGFDAGVQSAVVTLRSWRRPSRPAPPAPPPPR